MTELKIGDTVLPVRGRGGPWVVASIGSQPSMFGPDVEVAVFEDGSFMDVERLKKATDAS